MPPSLYAQTHFREAAGAELRPGGISLTNELAMRCDLKPGQLVLDLGCGVGSTASFLARSRGVTAVGLDRAPDLLQEARLRDSTVTWVLGEAQQAPYPDGYFDAVFAECFLSSLDDAMPVLYEARRVLRPGGRLAVTDLYLRNAPPVSLGSLPAVTCLRGALTAPETKALYQRAGFQVLVWRDRSEVLKALMASLILAYGSQATFWKAAGVDGEALARLGSARPGYYLLVAERLPECGADSGAKSELRS